MEHQDSLILHVLGSKGFIGSNIITYLDEHGLHGVGHESIDSFRNWIANSSHSDRSSSSAVWAIGKISPFLAEHRADLVYEEVETFRNFLADDHFRKIPLTLLSSGGCAYSDQSIFEMVETAEAKGINAYGRAKVAMEELLLKSGSNGNILRLGNVYGASAVPRKGQGVISHWLSDWREDRPIKIFGALDLKRDYIHISDVCQAIYLSQAGAYNHEVFNVGTGKGTDLQTLKGYLDDLLGEVLEAEHLPGRAEDAFSYWLNTQKFSLAFNWKPRVSLKDGIADFLI